MTLVKVGIDPDQEIFVVKVVKGGQGVVKVVKVRYLDTSGPSMAGRSTRPWERRHLLSTDWGCIANRIHARSSESRKRLRVRNDDPAVSELDVAFFTQCMKKPAEVFGCYGN